MRATDLVNAWAYVDAHPDEIERQIAEDEGGVALARLYADENFPHVVAALLPPDHDVLA